MSRIGSKPIQIPEKVTVNVTQGNTVKVAGPNGMLEQKIHPEIQVKQVDSTVTVAKQTDKKHDSAQQGLARMLIQNMVQGVTKGHKKSLQVIGLGYTATAEGQRLDLNLGKSHVTTVKMPDPVQIQIETTKSKDEGTYIHLTSADKQLVGQVAAIIRVQRPPCPYITKRSSTQKGIRYTDEILIGKVKKDSK